MSRVGRTGLIVVLCVLGAGIIRAARTDTGDALGRADGSLATAAEAAGLQLKPPTPTVSIAAPPTVAPGTTADIVATGVFPEGSTLRMRDAAALAGPGGAAQCFTVAKQQMTGNQARLTVSVLPTALPGAGTLELVTKDGRTAGEAGVYVAGKWQFDLTADNGWRVQLTPKTVPANARELLYSVAFFKGTEAAPFKKRDGRLSLSEDYCGDRNPSMSFSLSEPSGDDECATTQTRVAELGKRMGTPGPDQAKAMQEYMAIQPKMQACMEKQMKANEAMIKKMSDPAGQKEMQAEQDNFGCGGVYLQPATGGAVKGSLNCGKNVGYPKVTGTIKYLGAK